MKSQTAAAFSETASYLILYFVDSQGKSNEKYGTPCFNIPATYTRSRCDSALGTSAVRDPSLKINQTELCQPVPEAKKTLDLHKFDIQ